MDRHHLDDGSLETMNFDLFFKILGTGSLVTSAIGYCFAQSSSKSSTFIVFDISFLTHSHYSELIDLIAFRHLRNCTLYTDYLRLPSSNSPQVMSTTDQDSSQLATKDDIKELKVFILEREIVAMRWILGVQITYFFGTLAAVWFLITHH